MSETAGKGLICARLLPPSRLVLPSLSFQYPLKLISSSLPSSKCLTVFVLSYGGGLVSNDHIDLTAVVEDAAKLCLLTQGGPAPALPRPARPPRPAPHHCIRALPLTTPPRQHQDI